MSKAQLKKIRVAVSLLFFILTFLLFIDLRNFYYKISDQILFFQFIPSFLDTLAIFSASSLGFIIITLISLVIGRVYCSSICPLGTLQDMVIWVSRRSKPKRIRKKFHSYSLPHNTLRYGILILTILSAFIGLYFILDFLDPYSNFGRIISTFVKPAVVWINNSLSTILSKFNNYSILPVIYRKVDLWQFIFPIVMVGLVFWLSNKFGRLYCNTVCPVGTLLGFLSKFSLFKIAINPNACNHCGQCVYDCKAGCIDKDEQTVDFSRCISCFNCFTACSSDALYFRNSIIGKIPEVTAAFRTADVRKRKFLAKSFLFLTASMGLNIPSDSIRINRNVVAKNDSRIPENKQWIVLPPGAQDIKRFNLQCTACTLCVSACPNNVLQPTFLQFGLEGMMQPFMNYSTGFCNYDCKICGDVCPTGAILKIDDLEVKKTIQMGKAKFIKENCVVFTDETDCGACSEHCPTKAVNMVPYEDTGLFIPEVDDTICVGCGACEYPCPVKPYKAIYVDGNPVQLVADKPKIEKLEGTGLEEDEFPF